MKHNMFIFYVHYHKGSGQWYSLSGNLSSSKYSLIKVFVVCSFKARHQRKYSENILPKVTYFNHQFRLEVWWVRSCQNLPDSLKNSSFRLFLPTLVHPLSHRAPNCSGNQQSQPAWERCSLSRMLKSGHLVKCESRLLQCCLLNLTWINGNFQHGAVSECQIHCFKFLFLIHLITFLLLLLIILMVQYLQDKMNNNEDGKQLCLVPLPGKIVWNAKQVCVQWS